MERTRITPIKCPLKDEEGRTIFPDTPDGKYRKVNDVWYQATLLAAEEYELRVDEEMKERISDDETNYVAMGMTKTYYDSLCDPDGGTQIGMPANLAKYDCHAYMIRSTPPGIEQTRMMAKMRYIVARNLVNVKRPKKVKPETTDKNTKSELGNMEFETKAQPHISKMTPPAGANTSSSEPIEQ